ncbi:MAG: Alpha/beta hydrolase family protein [Labilithrix sp.]|nr:Alpha/beta hydrolase family protein [Labilithrix sp.]
MTTVRASSFFIIAPLLAIACSNSARDDTASDDSHDDYETTSQAIGANPLGVKTEEICFVVHNPGDPNPISVTGTRFSQRSFAAVKPNNRVLLLSHGAVETREIFDGGKAGIDVGSSFARRLAKQGYMVVTVDRAGYGDSPYVRGPGAGFSLNFNSYVEMTHEIVTQLHAGTYTKKTGSSCGTGPSVGLASTSVILGGHSIGGGESMLYASRYHDIDALISFAWNNTGAASIGTGFFVNWIVPQFQQGKDYVTFFPPGPSGVSDACVLGFFSQPLAQTAVAPVIPPIECANANLGKSPSGELAGTPALRQANLAALGGVGPTPALLTFADLDTMVAGANNPAGDPDHSGQEIALWQQNCNCDVSSYTQPAAGHSMFAHETMPELVDNVVGWLHSRDLGPR